MERFASRRSNDPKSLPRKRAPLSETWAHLGSNQGPLACEASALPLSYAPGSAKASGARSGRPDWRSRLRRAGALDGAVVRNENRREAKHGQRRSVAEPLLRDPTAHAAGELGIDECELR